MNDSSGSVLALAVGGAAAGAAAGALVVSLLSSSGGAPAPVATPAPDLKKVTIQLKEDTNGLCNASFVDPNDKVVHIEEYEPGVKFEVYNEDCDQEQVFRLKEKRGTALKRPLLVACRFHAQVPADVPKQSSINPFPVCTFPLELQYKGRYEYIVQLCTKDEGTVTCKNQDPEIEVKRR